MIYVQIVTTSSLSTFGLFARNTLTMGRTGILALIFLSCGFSIALEESTATEPPVSKSLAAISQAFIDIEKFYHTDNVSVTVQSDDAPDVSVDKVGIASDASVVSVCGTVNLNKIVDELLDSLRQDIINKGFDQLSIPNINETFTKKVGVLKMKGNFVAQKGWVRSLSTVHRTADVIASSHGRDLTVSCGFGLSHLEVGYDKYKAKFMDLGPTGKLNGIVGKNSLLLNATIVWKGTKCTATLNDLALSQFGGLRLNVTGLGQLNWLFSKISTWLVKNFKDKIKSKLEDTLKVLIEGQLANLDCGKYILGT